MVKKGTLASPATARAVSVLPVPGGPTSRTPRGNSAAELLELLRIAQEFDDLLQVLLGLVDAGDVLERDAALRLGQKLRLGLAEAHRLAGAALHLAGHVDPEAEEQQDRQNAGDDREQPVVAVGRRLGRDRHVLLVERLDEARVARSVGLERAPVLHVAGNLRPGDRDVANVACVDVAQQLAERDFARRGLLAGALEQRHQRQDKQENNHPQGEISIIRVHSLPMAEGGGIFPGVSRSSRIRTFKRAPTELPREAAVRSARKRSRMNWSLLAASRSSFRR